MIMKINFKSICYVAAVQGIFALKIGMSKNGLFEDINVKTSNRETEKELHDVENHLEAIGTPNVEYGSDDNNRKVRNDSEVTLRTSFKNRPFGDKNPDINVGRQHFIDEIDGNGMHFQDMGDNDQALSVKERSRDIEFTDEMASYLHADNKTLPPIICWEMICSDCVEQESDFRCFTRGVLEVMVRSAVFGVVILLLLLCVHFANTKRKCNIANRQNKEDEIHKSTY